jgi:excisionase family DNA binding protein
MEKLLNIRELADRLGISKLTAYHWLSQGRLPCIRFSARCVRFRESDLENMLEHLKQNKGEGEPRTTKN